MKRKTRISNRILILVSIAIILAVSIILGTTGLLVSNYNNDIIGEQVQNGVKTLSEKVDALKESTAGFARLAVNDRQIAAYIQDSDAGGLEKTAKSILDGTKTDFVIFTDESGKTIGSAGLKSNNDHLEGIEVVGSALKGNAISTIEADIVAHFSAVTAAPIKDSEGSVKGAVIIGYVLDNPNMLDELKEQVGTDVTIFQNNIRINTTIEKDGVRQVGTQLSETVANVVINEGKDYDSKADILGSRYFCSYRPLRNHNNETIGVVFAGRSMESATQLLLRIAYIAIAAAAASILAVIAVLVVYLRKVLAIPLRKVMNAAEEISEGGLDVKLDIRSNNEIGMLAAAFEKMADRLRLLISRAFESSDNVAAASKEIAASSLSLSKESVEQAATVQELSSTTTEVLTMTQANAENARSAWELSEKVKGRCSEGNDKLKELLGAMDGINGSSKKISKIIQVIDDIAFQTNILSLNAAVEAAQAGQYGKGFAVVAENVKQLALRSAKAAKEIAGMIEESVASSKSGTEMAGETASILTDIFEKVNEVNAMIAEISSSSAEQSSGISQINSAIERMASILQSYSAMAEESSAASAKLSEQAELLKQQALSFKLQKEQTP